MGDRAVHFLQLGVTAHDGDAGEVEPTGELGQVDDVEAAEGDAVEEDEVELGKEFAGEEGLGDAIGGVPAIYSEVAPDHAFEAGACADDACEGDFFELASLEGGIVEADDADGAVELEEAREVHGGGRIRGGLGS